MSVVIDAKGTIRRECFRCGRWIATRGYSRRIFKHKGGDGSECPGTMGKPGDDREVK